MMTKKTLIFLLTTAFLVACNPVDKDALKKIIKENPDIVTEAIEANHKEFLEAFQSAAKKYQTEMAEKKRVEEEKQLQATYDNPFVPSITEQDAVYGDRNAPIKLVIYSDFQCPYCERGFKTVQSLLQKYGAKIQYIFKHLPLSFHPHAMPAAEYFEAIRLQSTEKAFKFHNYIFQNQSKIERGAPFLEKAAKEVGANVSRIKKDLADNKIASTIREKINADMEEAKKFGIQGTPGFIINGVPVRGAYPAEHFETVVEELIKRGKLTL
ncbi:MAG: thioredoxin domain-containing protein [Halobacteriovoraceae bacterium]|nr:thioredoxin domain-containing protein [Halobacteriovoraceae bacterium]